MRFPQYAFFVLACASVVHAQSLLDVEREIWQSTNELRVANNAPALELDSVLSEIARGHSEEMLAQGFFSHQTLNNPYCKRVADRLKHGYRFCLSSAENIHKSQGYPRGRLAKVAVQSWRESANHHRNLVNPRYNRVGVGVAMKGDVALFTQVFTYEPILIRSLDVSEEPGGYRVKVTALVSSGAPKGGWFVDGKRRVEWEAGPDGIFSSELRLDKPGELDVGQAEGRNSWILETTIPIPPPDKHFRHLPPNPGP